MVIKESTPTKTFKKIFGSQSNTYRLGGDFRKVKVILLVSKLLMSFHSEWHSM